MTWKTIDDMALAGKVVLTRVDINVPMEGAQVTDATRIEKIVPTVEDLIARGAKVVLLAHFGRPKGKTLPEMSLRLVLPELEAALDRSVTFMEHPSREAINALPQTAVVLAENMRFSPLEEANDPQMAADLAALGDYFCNDAFSAAHRAHASTVGVAAYLPSYVGLLMEQEVEALSNLLEKPARPFAAIVGGGKVSSKVAVLEALIKKVDLLILGGGVANTFLVASGRSVGKSLYESKMVDDARRILKLAQDRGVRVLLPVDGVVAKEVTRGTEFKVVSTDKLPASWHMVDLGPGSITAIREALAPIKTILWNGPLGVFEIPSFAVATRELAKVAAEKADAGATVVVGGGDSIAALRQLGVAEKMTHLSTGGGASLEFLEGRDLPGLAVVPTAGSP